MCRVTKFLVTFLIVSLLTSVSYSSEYEGFGGETPGGSGQPLYRVTNLGDSGPGTLRDAVSRGNRYIVFDVGGEINLSSRIHVKGSYITIDGFSAPAPGVTLKGWGLYMWGKDGAHNIIIRGIRVRNSGGDGLHVSKGAHDIVIDRSSVAFAGDGNIDITEAAYNVTVSRTILAEPAAGNKNMLIMYDAPRRITLHHNLFTRAESRSPQVQTDGFGTPATDTTVDMRNNLIWDWGGGYGSRLRYGPRVNVINNFYAANGGDARDSLIVCPGPGCDDSNPASAARVYANGNISADGINLDARGNESAPFSAAPVDTHDALTAACIVLSEAGARPLDSLDQQYLSSISLPWCTQPSSQPSQVDVSPRPIPDVSPSTTPDVSPANGYFKLVNAGGGTYTDSSGNRWNADQPYTPGSWGYLGGRTYSVSNSIANTNDDPLYQSERHGTFSYRFDVPNGLYDVTLHLAEVYWNAPDQRIFEVLIEGSRVLQNYDIFKLAGRNVARAVLFTGVQVRDGQLNIDFLTVRDNAKVAAISISSSGISSSAASSTVLPSSDSYAQRVNAGGGSYFDSQGIHWSADQPHKQGSWGYVGGTTYNRTDPIGNTSDDFLYQSERYGTFSYRFDVPNGQYDITLHFAEIYWNQPDQRIFNVLIEGALVLDHYDIYATNGKNNAISITFSGVRVADGRLDINFVAVNDHAKIAAISVSSSAH